METRAEGGTKTKHSKIKGRKIKHGHHKKRKFGGDYSDNNEWQSKCIHSTANADRKGQDLLTLIF